MRLGAETRDGRRNRTLLLRAGEANVAEFRGRTLAWDEIQSHAGA
jgi:hypothetical protein